MVFRDEVTECDSPPVRSVALEGALHGDLFVALAWEEESVGFAVLLVLCVVNEPPRPRVLQHRAEQRQLVHFPTLNLVGDVDCL